MAARLRFSHVLIRVDDLKAAVADYAALGFTCVWGSAPERAHNALIYFEDGPFLELFKPPPASAAAELALAAVMGRPAARRVRRWGEAPCGLVEYALETDDADLKAVRAASKAAGAPLGRIVGTTRTRPDGVKLAWQMLTPAALDLPFAMGAYTPPDTQPDAVRRHANGARRVGRMDLAHPDPADLGRRLTLLLGEDPAAQGIAIAKGAAYAIASLTLEGLAADIPPAGAHGAVFLAAQSGASPE
ncbi:VOC family protein [Phenylobacterium sp.]|uniref:VOC family protein n=1 Tax=Phenylobacterium sp. TaxID=1871053 RepID=UPI0025D42151|nr:VOC family protein [Phenylobacterium sp.]MBX3483815.1 VOC family protein [Phenylobacterium sp.]